MEYNEMQFLRNPKSPESILGLFGKMDLSTLNEQYNVMKEKLMAARDQGQKGDGSRIIPDQEYAERMSEIENAYKIMLEKLDEDEIITSELDPSLPDRIVSK